MNILRVSFDVQNGVNTGRELLTDINGQALRSIFGRTLFDFFLSETQKPRGVRKLFNALQGWLNGLDHNSVEACLDVIEGQEIQIVYVEGSNYGRLVRAIKLACPSCRIITFFHNVETRFFWGAFRTRPSLRALGVLIGNFVAEAFAVRYSDRIICLNERDSVLLGRIFRRSATDIHPLCIADRRKHTHKSAICYSSPMSLFVGGAFYANLDGIRWFGKNVAGRLPCKTYVVGKDFELYTDQLGKFSNLQIVGSVGDLQPWYEQASLIVAPIFDGSGMKTKIAEALMFGRPVIGTSEAFVGYEAIAERVGIICNDAESFVAAFEQIVSGLRSFDPDELRTLYLENYSLAAKERYFRYTFGELSREISQ